MLDKNPQSVLIVALFQSVPKQNGFIFKLNLKLEMYIAMFIV